MLDLLIEAGKEIIVDGRKMSSGTRERERERGRERAETEMKRR